MNPYAIVGDDLSRFEVRLHVRWWGLGISVSAGDHDWRTDWSYEPPEVFVHIGPFTVYVRRVRKEIEL